jgi:hypothetical protein
MGPAQVTAWIAFRDPRSFADWDAFSADKLNRPWAEWGFLFGIEGREDQATLLLAALKSRAEGKVWVGPTEEFGGAWKRSCRAHVRRLMRKFDVPATELASQLEQDIATQTVIDRRLEEARRQMVVAVRDELLNAFGHRAYDDGKSDPNAVAKKVDSSLFLGPRTINYDGWLRADVDRRLEEWAGCTGPCFDRVHFRTDDILTLWPADGADNSKQHRMMQASQRKRKGGRRPEYDWYGVAREMIRLANTPDGLPDRSALREHLYDWCEKTWGKSPSDSMLRDLLARLCPDEI